MKAKNWYQSRTIWINGLVTLAGIFTALAGELAAGGTLTALGVVNVALRYVTKHPIQ